jgi:hypothetical protein
MPPYATFCHQVGVKKVEKYPTLCHRLSGDGIKIAWQNNRYVAKGAIR